MKYPLSKFRNIGIAAHIDAGKTTVTERILFYTGVVHKIGEVHEGAATTDWMEQERERGITITAAAITSYWKDHQINIIDTPGHVDFTIEVERSMRVLDGVVIVFSAVDGVQPQSETVWRQANRYHVPRLIFVNKMDRIGGDYFAVLDDVREKLHARPVAMQIPVGVSEDFHAIIDVLHNRMSVYKDDVVGGSMEFQPVPAEYEAQVKDFYNKIVEAACDCDDALAEKYLNEEEITLDEVKAGLRKGVIEQKIMPAFCGTAFKNKGVQLLLDGIVEFLPSPLDIPPVKGVLADTNEEILVETDPKAEMRALVFKIMTDPYVGVLNFIRMYSGEIKAGSYVYNARTQSKERVSRIVRMHANKREEVELLAAGDIGALVGIKDAITGDTLYEGKRVLLESINVPTPVIATSIEPKNKSDYEKMAIALRKLMQEDPSFRFSYNEETGQTEISGMGELHLEIIVDRLKREHKVEVTQGKLQVAYKETVQSTAEAEGKFIRQSGGRGQYGHVWLRIEPLERGKGFEFEDKIVGGAIPKEFIPGAQKGVEEAINSGVIGGYPVVDCKVTLYDGSFHDVDSSELAFKIAASMAFRASMAKANPVLLEPIMKVVVNTPEENMGDVMGDLNARRGRILGMEPASGKQEITAEVPLGEMFGYATILRSMTKGRADYSMEFECYREVPKNVVEQIKEKK